MKPAASAPADALSASPRRAPVTRFVRAVALVFAALLGIVVAAGAVLLATALYALRAAPGDWAMRTAIGPLGVSLSVPCRVAMLRPSSRRMPSGWVATRSSDGTLSDTPSGPIAVRIAQSPGAARRA